MRFQPPLHNPPNLPIFILMHLKNCYDLNIFFFFVSLRASRQSANIRSKVYNAILLSYFVIILFYTSHFLFSAARNFFYAYPTRNLPLMHKQKGICQIMKIFQSHLHLHRLGKSQKAKAVA